MIKQRKKIIMAGVTIRKGIYYAVWKINGKNKIKTTGIRASGNGTMSRQKAEAMARQIANSMEAVSKGTPLDKALDAVRGVAELQGSIKQVPSVRDYLNSVPATTSPSSERNRKRSFQVFLSFLGDIAERRLDAITYDMCRRFIQEQLKQVSKKTVTQYHTYILRAFSDAQDIHGYITRNPMRPVSVAAEARLIAPERSDDKQVRQAFSAADIRRLLTDAPIPWRYMVAVSYYLGGLRLGDVCLMRWADIHMEDGYVSIREEKTKRLRKQPIIRQLRDVLEKMRQTQGEKEEYLFPLQAHMFQCGSRASVSTCFTSLLQAMGITDTPTGGKPEGRRKRISPKTFHSIRHTVVSLGRVNAQFTSDLIRDTVGHESEQVERGYFHSTLLQRATVLSALADCVAPQG